MSEKDTENETVNIRNVQTVNIRNVAEVEEALQKSRILR